MVNHDTGEVTCCRGIGAIVDIFFLTSAETHVTDDDVIAIGIDRIVAQGNARGRSGLTENGGVGSNVQVAPEGNDTSYIEDDNLLSRTTDGRT